MAYKRYFYRNGKKFGPYYYESYRDNSGKVRKKYVGTKPPTEDFKNKKIKLVTPTFLLIILAVLLITAGALIYNYNQVSSQISGTGKAVLEVGKSVYGSIARIIGLSIEDAEESSLEKTSEKEEESSESKETEQIKEEINETEEQAEETETTEPEEELKRKKLDLELEIQRRIKQALK